MKILKCLILFLLFVTIKSKAQTFQIDTSSITFEDKLRPCLFVRFDANATTVKKGWSSFMKKNYDIKVKGIGFLTDRDIVEAEDVIIRSIADKRMNMYARVTEIPNGSEMKYFMSFGYDFFIGPENFGAEFDGMHKLLNDFCISFLHDYYSDEINDILKRIKGYEKDIKHKNREIDKNIKKSKKESAALASGLAAKNNTLAHEIDQLRAKIEDLQQELEVIKEKQEGIPRN